MVHKTTGSKKSFAKDVNKLSWKNDVATVVTDAVDTQPKKVCVNEKAHKKATAPVERKIQAYDTEAYGNYTPKVVDLSIADLMHYEQECPGVVGSLEQLEYKVACQERILVKLISLLTVNCKNDEVLGLFTNSTRYAPVTETARELEQRRLKRLEASRAKAEKNRRYVSSLD